MGQNSSGNFLFATDFRFGTVEMFDASFTQVKSFSDPALASDCPLRGQCFAPFGIQNIGGKVEWGVSRRLAEVLVKHAAQTAPRPAAGPG